MSAGLIAKLKELLQAKAQMSKAPMDYFNTFSPEDQASIRSSWGLPTRAGGPFGAMRSIGAETKARQDWYNNANAAGAVPAPAPAPAAAAAGALNAFGGGSAAPAAPVAGTPKPAPTAVPGVAAPAPATKPADYGGFSDPYELWKQKGRPNGTFASWEAAGMP